jgi:hypothetical protein
LLALSIIGVIGFAPSALYLLLLPLSGGDSAETAIFLTIVQIGFCLALAIGSVIIIRRSRETVGQVPAMPIVSLVLSSLLVVATLSIVLPEALKRV